MKIGRWYYWESDRKRYILPLGILGGGEKFIFIIGDEGSKNESDVIKWYGNKYITRTRVDIGSRTKALFWDLRTDYMGNYFLTDKQLAPKGLPIPLKLPSDIAHKVIKIVIGAA